MPNHVTNAIISTPFEIAKLRRFFSPSEERLAGSVHLDFNRLIPQPDGLILRDVSSAWGTKWNSYATAIDSGSVIFQTAWNRPQPIVRAIAGLPSRPSFVWLYADEDWGRNFGAYRCDSRCKYPLSQVFLWRNGSCDAERFAEALCNRKINTALQMVVGACGGTT